MGGHSDASARVKEAKGLDLWLLFLVIGTLGAFVIFGMAQEAVTRTKFGEGEKTEQFKFTTFLVRWPAHRFLHHIHGVAIRLDGTIMFLFAGAAAECR
eukprot:SAG11_NODE_507_length_8879_cov_8.961048_12_plen_98_part_00